MSPAQKEVGEGTRRRIRALAFCNIFAFFCCVIALVIAAVVPGFMLPLVAFLLVGMTFLMFCAAVFIRMGKTQLGAMIFLLTLVLYIYIRPWIGIPPERVAPLMAYAVAIQTVATLFLSFRGAKFIYVVNVVGLIAPLIVLPQYRTLGAQQILVFALIQMSLLMFIAKIHEKEREIAAKATANKAMSELSSRLAHALNSPINTIKICTEILQSDLLPNAAQNEDLRLNLMQIKMSTERAALIAKGLHFIVETKGNCVRQKIQSLSLALNAAEWLENVYGAKMVTVNIQEVSRDLRIFTNEERSLHLVCILLTSIVKQNKTSLCTKIAIATHSTDCCVELCLGDCNGNDRNEILAMIGNDLVIPNKPDQDENLEAGMALRLASRIEVELVIGYNMEKEKYILRFPNQQLKPIVYESSPLG